MQNLVYVPVRSLGISNTEVKKGNAFECEKYHL